MRPPRFQDSSRCKEVPPGEEVAPLCPQISPNTPQPRLSPADLHLSQLANTLPSLSLMVLFLYLIHHRLAHPGTPGCLQPQPTPGSCPQLQQAWRDPPPTAPGLVASHLCLWELGCERNEMHTHNPPNSAPA